MGTLSDTSVDTCGRWAALLSAIEVGLGSILHGLHIPFSGQFLSLNQGFLLSRATLANRHRTSARTLAANISSIASLLKSLSPAGKKLTPMLALAAQGCLFSIGTLSLGVNPIGITVGMVLLCLWAFVQPLLLYYAFYGNTLIDVAQFYFKKFGELTPWGIQSLIWTVFSIGIIKLLLGLGLVVTAFWLPEHAMENIYGKLLNAGRTKRIRLLEQLPNSEGKAMGAFRDLFNPLFIVSVLLTLVFFYFANTTRSQMLWAILRPVAVGFIIFYGIRWIQLETVLKWLEAGRTAPFGKSLRVAVETLKNI